jgi:hypothetical protein
MRDRRRFDAAALFSRRRPFVSRRDGSFRQCAQAPPRPSSRSHPTSRPSGHNSSIRWAMAATIRFSARVPWAVGPVAGLGINPAPAMKRNPLG